MRLEFVGQEEITIRQCDCRIWEKDSGRDVVSVTPGVGPSVTCECAPDPLKIGGAVFLVGLAWWLFR